MIKTQVCFCEDSGSILNSSAKSFLKKFPCQKIFSHQKIHFCTILKHSKESVFLIRTFWTTLVINGETWGEMPFF